MIRRREFVTLLGGAAAAWPLSASGQTTAMPLVGFLSGRSLNSDRHLVTAFRKGMAEAGFVEGNNATMEFRWADGRTDRLLELAAELIQHKPSVVFAGAIDVRIKALKETVLRVPIVFATGGRSRRTRRRREHQSTRW